jgi:Family of unknown function (DUF5906)/Primase C terminal 2 (PriCT-2)
MPEQPISPPAIPCAILDPASAEHRMWLGRVQPMGNPSYLAHMMGADSPVQPRRAGMPLATFPCPVCKGTAGATAHPTILGAMTLTCAGKGCDCRQLAQKCRDLAPRAFSHSDDLLVEMPDAVVDALIARAKDGSFAEGHKAAMRAIDKRRANAAGVTPYVLRNPEGCAVILILRYEEEVHGAPTKSMQYFHASMDIDGRLETVVGLPDGPWPLIGLDNAARRPDRPRLVVEGEKAWSAAQKLLPEYVVVASLCGSGNAHCSDWSAMAGAELLVMGDADAPGDHYARSVAAQALAAGAASVRVVPPLPGAPAGWDLADPLPEGITLDELRQHIATAPPVDWDEVKDALRGEQRDWPPFRLPDGHFAGKRTMVEAIGEALDHIDPGCHRLPWWAVLACLHHALGQDGLAMAVAWSRRDEARHGKFREGEVERIFDQLTLRPIAHPMTVADLFWRAYRESAAASKDGEGWRADPAAMADAQIAAFGERHRKLIEGDNVYIAIQKRLSDGRYDVERKSEATAESIYKAERVTDHAGKKQVSVYKLWEVGQKTKPLRVVFRPGKAVAADEYNSFQGFAVQPIRGAGSYKMYRDLINRVCKENGDTDQWLWSCMAYRLQHPDRRMNSAVCFVGDHGSGKSKLTDVIAKLMVPHSITISHPDRFVGRNNACLTGMLFVQCEELVVGRRQDWTETLRHYITSPTIDVEEKYKAQTQVENAMWIAFTSNSKEVVKVPRGERRFAMYSVSDPFDGDQAKRSAHYAALDAELDAGGREALMYDLLHYPIPDGFDPKRVPVTPLLRELMGMDTDADPVAAWWREVLEAGILAERKVDTDAVEWSKPIPTRTLYSEYAGFCELNGARAKAGMLALHQWAKVLGDLLPGGLVKRRMSVKGERGQFYVMPPYDQCCDAFDKKFGVKIDRAPLIMPGEEAAVTEKVTSIEKARRAEG